MLFLLSENESHSVVSNSLQPHGLHSPWNSPDQNTGVGSLSLLQGIFPTQESNWGLLHCGQILYQLSWAIREALRRLQISCFYKIECIPMVTTYWKKSTHLIMQFKKPSEMKPIAGPFCTAMLKNRNADILIRIKRIAPLASNCSMKK